MFSLSGRPSPVHLHEDDVEAARHHHQLVQLPPVSHQLAGGLAGPEEIFILDTFIVVRDEALIIHVVHSSGTQ